MLVLVTAYTIANISAYVALKRLDPAVYTVLSQLKLFTTAMFSVCFLNTYFSNTKIRALVSLALGGILVTSPNFNLHPCDNGNVDNTFKVKCNRYFYYVYMIIGDAYIYSKHSLIFLLVWGQVY